MCLRSFSTLQEAVHRSRQDKRLGAVIAQHLPRSPWIFAIGKTDVEFLFGCLRHTPLKTLRLILIREGLVQLPLWREVSDASGHAQSITKSYLLPPIMGSHHWKIVFDLEIEHLVAILLRQPQESNRSAKRLGHGKDPMSHLLTVRIETIARVAASKIDDTIHDQPIGADVFGRSLTVKALQPFRSRRNL